MESNDRGRDDVECRPRTGQADLPRPALQLMGSTVRLRLRCRGLLIDFGAIGPFCSGCSQVKQPGLVKEAVGPSGVILESFGLPFSFDSFSQDASQSSSDPTVHCLECIPLAIPKVVKLNHPRRIGLIPAMMLFMCRATVFCVNGAGSAAHYFVGTGAWGTVILPRATQATLANDLDLRSATINE